MVIVMSMNEDLQKMVKYVWELKTQRNIVMGSIISQVKTLVVGLPSL
jgi:hypothetical protein